MTLEDLASYQLLSPHPSAASWVPQSKPFASQYDTSRPLWALARRKPVLEALDLLDSSILAREVQRSDQAGGWCPRVG